MNKFETVNKYNTFVKSDNIVITEEQKEAIRACGRAFQGFADAMLKIMNANTVGLAKLGAELIKALQQPEKDYTQKYKPWKKDRFYY